MSNSSSKGYKFNIVNGAVAAVYEVKNGRVKFEKMDSDEVWSVEGTNVIKTEYEHGRQEVTVFNDIDGDGIFAKVSKNYVNDSALQTNGTVTPLQPTSTLKTLNGYQFEIINGNVTAVIEIERGYRSPERMDSNEIWTVEGANVVKQEVEHGVTETSTYTDADGDGIFSKVSKTYLTTDGNAWSGATSGTDSDDQWRGDGSDDHFYAGNGNDRLSGGVGDDELYGADGDDQMLGEQGSDDLYGGIGNDVISGGEGIDHLEGGLDNDRLDGGSDNDHLNGGSGTDTLVGGVGNDVLYGEDGHDMLFGGAGSDELYGGSGNDLFRYTHVSESGISDTTSDHIHEFSDGDKLDLAGIDAKVGNWTNDAFTYIGTASNLTLANANGAVWFENGILYGSTDRDTAAEFQIALVGVTQITTSALIL